MRDEPRPYSLFPALRGYGIWNILRSGDLYAALLISFILTVVLSYERSIEVIRGDATPILATSVALSGAVLGLILAAFAILMGFSDARFTVLLSEADDALSDVVGLFWYVGMVAALAAASGLGAIVVASRFEAATVFLFFIALFLTLYALFATVGLVRTVGRLSLARADFLKSKGGESKESRGDGQKHG